MRSPAPTFDLRAALAREIRDALAEFDSVPAKPKALHACRVHIKRARALARVGRACAPGLAGVFNESARAVMAALSTRRDLAALAEAARALAEKQRKKSAAALKAVADELDAAQAGLAALNLEGVRAGLKDLLAIAQVWPEASGRQIRKGAERIARRARRAWMRGDGASLAAKRHAWRKREKDRVHAVTLLDKAWPEDRARRRKLGELLGEALGRERDALLLIERVESGASVTGKTAQRALRALYKRREQLARRADRLGAKLHRGGA
jgi:CHAD domain-containing protein